MAPCQGACTARPEQRERRAGPRRLLTRDAFEIMSITYISASQQKHAAQSFAFFSSIAMLIPVLIPIWIAASIFVYAAVAHHPNPRVRDYVKYPAYRFYGVVGALVAVLNFSSPMASVVGGALPLAILIWILCLLVVVPLGVRDFLRAGREPWQDMQFESDEHEQKETIE